MSDGCDDERHDSGPGGARVFIPCPQCRAPIEVPARGKLPATVTCRSCGAKLVR